MTIFYPDVSSFQTGISFAGCVIAMTKATENDNYTNPDYAPARARAAGAGAYFCAYHFLHAGNGAGQASHAHGVVGVRRSADDQLWLPEVSVKALITTQM
jgi:GH25 family lysozyme M1 (1,4-beta-N-acetylmuramidase)